jgi:hypothetical protein
VVAIDGRPVALELFDSAAAFSRYPEKLTRSYALDAIETANGKPLAPSEAKVRRTSGSPARASPAARSPWTAVSFT